MNHPRSIAMLAALWLVVSVTSTPVRRSPDLEARRRSAIDRSMIRFGRSTLPVVPPAQPSFLQRYSASQPAALTADDLMTFLRAYEEDYSSPVSKKSASFVRFGRDPSFIRFGRSVDEENSGYQAETNTYPQRRHRARNHFIRLGRDNEFSESNDEDRYEVESERTKRSVVDPCNDCA
ncbi:FMRFamide-related peptides [Bombyx mandarina]|uniref:FMRFamide-related peptides n=1 Tax=Bombyx mandarina TaxID=7092 RepID=A0A6J2JCQ5_BOMMA|nr:FMRFamide-related peptides [Bombyx mandarina]